MADVGRVRVAVDVAEPLVFGRVGVARADVARLQGFELLLGAEFVGLGGWVRDFFKGGRKREEWGGMGRGGGLKRRNGRDGNGDVPFLVFMVCVVWDVWCV